MKKQTSEVSNLLSTDIPQQYLSFLFGLQNSLVDQGHFAGFTSKGFNEHVRYIGGLRDFFEELENEGQ